MLIYTKKNLRNIFKEAQSLFDKKFRFYKKKFKNKEIEDLGKQAAEDPTSVWKKLKRLGATPAKRVLEIVKEDGSLSREVGEILERWAKDISNLYAGLHESPDIAFDDNFFMKL